MAPAPRPSRPPAAALPSESPRTRALFAWASLVVPLVAAVFGTRAAPDPASDHAALRVLGLAFTGAFRALDVWVAAPFLSLPIGTRAVRAGLACAAMTGLSGWLTYHLAEPMLVPREVAGRLPAGPRKSSSRLAFAVAGLAAITAISSPPWQLEGSAVGGSVTGATLVLTAAWLASRPATPTPWKALVVGAALGWEPLVGLFALAVLTAPLLFAEVRYRARLPVGAELLRVAFGFLVGLVPLGLGFAIKAGPEAMATSAGVWDAALGEARGGGASWRPFARDEIGWVFVGAAGLGAALALRRPETRLRAVVLVLLALGFPLTFWLDLGHGPVRFAAPLLVSIAGLGGLASVGLYELVTRVRDARVPFAPASAALLVVLEWTLPVRAVDDAFMRRAALSRHAPWVFATAALGQAPPVAVVLVADRRVLTRLQAARAAGLLRADLTLFPTFDLKSPQARAAVNREPKLAGLYRDLALGTLPEEWSLSSLAGARPLVLTFDPKWKPVLAKHLVPDGLFFRFEPEPQGPSDRRVALERAAKRKALLAQELTGAGRDPAVVTVTAHLLRGRAIAMGATGERESLSKALDELRPYAPDDPVASKLVRRMVTTKGSFPVDDLAP